MSCYSQTTRVLCDMGIVLDTSTTKYHYINLDIYLFIAECTETRNVYCINLKQFLRVHWKLFSHFLHSIVCILLDNVKDYQRLHVVPNKLSTFYLLSLGWYLCWWIISLRVYPLLSSQCFYHWVDTSAGGLLVSECILCPVVSVSITGLIPLLVDY